MSDQGTRIRIDSSYCNGSGVIKDRSSWMGMLRLLEDNMYVWMARDCMEILLYLGD